MHKIGVFDSGAGGKSVARAIQRALAQSEVIYVNDRKNVPYGSKTSDELYGLVLPILQELASRTDIIVVACNTVSTTLIEPLRQQITIPLIAMEPMVKPAAERTKNKIIAVCATPTTLASQRYQYLKQTYAKGITVIEPDCSNWSAMIEADELDVEAVAEQVAQICAAGADVIVLGCTHYHWIEELIQQIAGDQVIVLQPEQATIKQLKRLLAKPAQLA